MAVELEEVKGEEVEVDNSPRLFIKISAAFTAGDSKLADLGVEVDEEPEYNPTYLLLPNIVSVYPNRVGGMNFQLTDGDMFSTKEDYYKIAGILDKLAVDLS